VQIQFETKRSEAMEFYLLSAQEMGRSASANSSDCLEFQELCEALKRNDSSVTRVHCTATSQELPAGYGYRLSAALAGNTIVTEIDLNLVHFLSPAEYKAQTAKAATPLLQWIEQSASLTTVKLSCERRRRSRIGGIQPSEVLLVQRIAHSMAQNPHDIRSLEWHLRYPGLLPSLTNYLVNDNGRKQVQSLALSICRDNAPTDLEEAARAVGALASLQRFTLCGSHPTFS
jgi:hypothetical protein